MIRLRATIKAQDDELAEKLVHRLTARMKMN